jgi:hypothetical protein
MVGKARSDAQQPALSPAHIMPELQRAAWSRVSRLQLATKFENTNQPLSCAAAYLKTLRVASSRDVSDKADLCAC